MKGRVVLAFIVLFSLFSSGGFLIGVWPYGIGLSNVAVFAFLAGWYLSRDIYILLAAGLALLSDGLSADIDFSHTKVVLAVIILTLVVRHQGFNPDKTRMVAIIGTAIMASTLWSYLSSGLAATYIWVAVLSTITGVLFWLMVVKLLPDILDNKLFGS